MGLVEDMLSASPVNMAGAQETPEGSEGDSPQQSLYACQHCKRRKIKCDRTLPRCSGCEKASRECDYPLTANKPGPKVGAPQRPRRKRESGASESKQDDAHIDKRLETATGQPILPAPTHAWLQPADTGLVDRRASFPPQSIPGLAFPSPRSNASIGGQSSPVATKGNPLSAIMHPNHEPASHAASPTRTEDVLGDGPLPREQLNKISQACKGLGISLELCEKLVALYFDNITWFSLFHRPTIEQKLNNVASTKHLQALLAAMFSFSRFHGNKEVQLGLGSLSPMYWFDLALRLIAEGLEECADDLPPLYLLQAMLITTFQQLIDGVRGKAWRALGECLRIAYELHLHLIDVDEEQSTACGITGELPPDWVVKEERRRTWWTLWEMDVFASTIRRLPTAIDWTLNKTKLPISDEDWLNYKDSASCHLSIDPGQRWKELEKSGNRGAQAWFAVINSYMRDAQRSLSSFPGSSSVGRPIDRVNTQDTTAQREEIMAQNMRDLLSNSLRCALMVMPAELTYHDEFLAFRGGSSDPIASATRASDCGRYSNHIMVQLTRFMLYHQIVYRSTPLDESVDPDLDPAVTQVPRSAKPELSSVERQAWEHYVDAADNIANVIRNSSPTHVRYVNPFLANTIWLAAAAQIVSRIFGPPTIDRRLAGSNFDVLRGTFNTYVSFWKVSPALKTKLDNMELKLDQLRRDSQGSAIPRTPYGGMTPNTAATFPSISTPQDQQLLQGGNDPTFGFNAFGNNFGTPNVDYFSFNEDDFFDNLGLQPDELFTYPYQ